MFSYNIDRIPNAGITVADELPHDTVTFLLGCMLRPVGATAPIRFEVAKRGTNVLVNGTIELEYAFECSRCAETFQRRTHIPLGLTFMEGTEIGEPGDDDEGDSYDVTGFETDEEAAAIGGIASPEDRELIFYQGRQIELEGPIFEQVVLGLPTYPVCTEECKGLCPNCGKNLNTESCTCAADVVDPRWSALKGLAAAIGSESKRSQ